MKKHYQGFKMTEIELGVKRRCISCGTKFYDFLKVPIICPNCAIEFDPEQLLKSRKGRVSSKSAVIEVVKKEKDEEGFQDNTLLDESELDPDIDDVEDDGLPSDEDEFITVSDDDDEATTTFANDEEFMDNLAEDSGEDDIDEDEETNPSSKKEEE